MVMVGGCRGDEMDFRRYACMDGVTNICATKQMEESDGATYDFARVHDS